MISWEVKSDNANGVQTNISVHRVDDLLPLSFSITNGNTCDKLLPKQSTPERVPRGPISTELEALGWFISSTRWGWLISISN